MKIVYAKLLLCGLCITFLNTVTINAKETTTYDYSCIPAEMVPDTKIEFVNDKAFVIRNGGFTKIETCGVISGIPKPAKGMVITYADDGRIQDIKQSDGNIPNYKPYLTINHDAIDDKLPITRANPKPQLVSQWGTNNRNKVYVTNIYDETGKRYRVWDGQGRATNFTDAEGNVGNLNSKGSIATKQFVDEPKNKTAIKVSAPTYSGGGKTVTMYKTDVGGLPDAIIDIWYTGVEYWGYKWKASLSIDDVTYTHR